MQRQDNICWVMGERPLFGQRWSLATHGVNVRADFYGNPGAIWEIKATRALKKMRMSIKNGAVNIFIASCQPIYTISLQLLNARVLKTVIYSELCLTLTEMRPEALKQEKLNVKLVPLLQYFAS